jgi:serine/threonine-protein kinase
MMRALADDTDRQAETYRLFVEALDVPADRRGPFLDEHCGSDSERRAEIAALLAIADADAAAGGLDTSALAGTAPILEQSLVGKVFGRFRLMEPIGEGGMGVVYRAERTDGIQQVVAVKLIAHELVSAGQERFRRETQLLARLEHPAIARLIDAGIDAGRAWMALEFVPGQSIDQYCEAQKLTIRARVRLLVLLADAVAAAHRMLVVHRDIKPANVLVTADGLPKLIDFGIGAALLEGGGAYLPTVDAGRLFTPHFAAPEQISGKPITVATDVFGLGALGYRLLSGRVPYADAEGPIGYMLAITQRDLDPASRVALLGAVDPRDAQQLRGDLDAILNKALERDPMRRYASAADLQADLQRYLDDLPVAARAPSPWVRAAKFARRNPAAVSLSMLLGISLVVGAIAYGLQARVTAQARNMAARRDEFLETLLESADPRAGRRDMSVGELLDSAAAVLDRKLASEPLVEASMLGLIADTNDHLGRYPQGLAASDRQLTILRAHGGSALELGRALSSRAELMREEGRWAEVEPLAREAVGLLRPLRTSAELADALSLLGMAQAHTYHEKDAEATYQEVIAIESRDDQKLKDRSSYPYYYLAGLMTDMGRYADAVVYAHQAVELARQTLPMDYPDVPGFQTQYASTLVNVHRAAEAEAVIRDSIALQTRVLGADHKDTLLSRWILADALIELHRDAEAAEVAHAAALKLESLLGADNHYTLAAWQTYGMAACNSGQVSEGLDATRRVEAARRQTLPPGDRFVQFAVLGTGLCLYRAGRYAEAEPVLLQAVSGLEAARGKGYRRTQDAYHTLRDLYLAMGRPDDAQRINANIRE